MGRCRQVNLPRPFYNPRCALKSPRNCVSQTVEIRFPRRSVKPHRWGKGRNHFPSTAVGWENKETWRNSALRNQCQILRSKGEEADLKFSSKLPFRALCPNCLSIWPLFGQYLTSQRDTWLLATINSWGSFSERQWRPSSEVRVLSCPGDRCLPPSTAEGKEVVPEAEAEELGVWLFGMWPGSDLGTTGTLPCTAAHSSPGGRPALEAQRKPRLSEAESGVLPILPPEKRKREWTFVEKGVWGLTQLYA